ncbi:hypothetical protein [Paracoccus pacificus]|uniref:Uncharacterized protein n=1 Tax=Paracoccus pacificus TaxID=1463598 RepID=A0ABW4RC43_9RHOB
MRTSTDLMQPRVSLEEIPDHLRRDIGLSGLSDIYEGCSGACRTLNDGGDALRRHLW